MRKFFYLAVVLSLILSLSGCGQKNPLSDFAEMSGVSLTEGRIVSEEDSHGGFHGDGYRLIVAEYSDDGIASEISGKENWRELPLSENLNTFVYQPYDERISIPRTEHGYYYFYDRHSECDHPYDDADFLNRHSFNFTLAIYDTDKNRLYLLEYDT